MSILITGLPRSGTSLVANLVSTAGYTTSLSAINLGSSEFNKQGYYEDIEFILLNDQIIRSHYGVDRSFLFPPSPHFKDAPQIQSSFNYDISNLTLQIPEYYKENVAEYCPCGWDSWGLTRMLPEQKWHMCYQKYGVDTKDGVLQSLNRYAFHLRNDPNLCLKDPRLLYAILCYSLDPSQKVILVERNHSDILNSMRRHYGLRLFSENIYDGYDWVSNHFNYKVPPLSFRHYIDNFMAWKSLIMSSFDVLTLDYDDIVSKREISRLNDFVGSTCDDTIIDLKSP